MKKCHIWMTREEIEPEALVGATAVVIDVFLATTTLVTIMENGPKRVIPVDNLEEARQLKEELGASCITGGEQGGLRVDEFDCGHLPDEFTQEKLADKDVVFLSTNGTRAICSANNAATVLIGNLRNAPAIADYLNTLDADDVYIICAGSFGHFSLEDFMCASIIASRLNLTNVRINDAIRIALDQRYEEENKIMETLKKSRVGQSFVPRGIEHLVDFTGQVGASDSLVCLEGRELGFMPARGVDND